MRRMLGDRLVMVVEEMPNRRIAADQHELLCRRALTEGLQQPEESLDCHVITVSAISLHVAKCTTCVTSRIARSTQLPSSMLPLTTSMRSVSAIVRLRHNALTLATRYRGSESSRSMRLTPTFPVAPVTRSCIDLPLRTACQASRSRRQCHCSDSCHVFDLWTAEHTGGIAWQRVCIG
jgi:hypothetical protein